MHGREGYALAAPQSRSFIPAFAVTLVGCAPTESPVALSSSYGADRRLPGLFDVTALNAKKPIGFSAFACDGKPGSNPEYRNRIGLYFVNAVTSTNEILPNNLTSRNYFLLLNSVVAAKQLNSGAAGRT